MDEPLSDDLKFFRCHKPDEWTMDDFTKKAKELEAENKRLREDIQNVIDQVPDKWSKGYLEQLLRELTPKEGK